MSVKLKAVGSVATDALALVLVYVGRLSVHLIQVFEGHSRFQQVDRVRQRFQLLVRCLVVFGPVCSDPFPSLIHSYGCESLIWVTVSTALM